MVNVGLRAYLWEQKSREERLTREFWSFNGVTYNGYRNFVSFVKDHGLQEIYAPSHPRLQLRPASQPSTEHDDGTSEVSMPSTHSAISHQSSSAQPGGGGASPLPADSGFATAKHMFDVDNCAVTVVRFARSGSPLLAMGLASGCTKIGTLAEPPEIVSELQGHNAPVTDLDWSGDNILLLTAGEDGHVVAWDVAQGQAVRAITAGHKMAAPCARFHPVNANLFIVGAASGDVRIINCSTGLCVAAVDTVAAAGAAQRPVAMAATPNMLCVGDASGYLHLWRAEIKDGQLQPLQLLARVPPPRGTSGALTTLEYVHYCKATGGPALLSATSGGSVCIWDLDTWTGRPKLRGRGKLLQAEGRLRASLNTMVMPRDPQYLAVGVQDNAVEVLDISDGIKKAPKLVSRLTGHASSVMDVSWSSGAPLLASSDSMGTVIIWEAHGSR